MIIGKVARQEALQMPCVEHDDMLQTLAPDAPKEALHVRVLPWTSRGDDGFLEPHVLDALPQGRAVDASASAQERAWYRVPRKGLHHLPCRPLGGRMLGHVAMDHASALMRHNHQDEEDPERHGWHGKEVQGHEILRVVGEKRLPCR